ncbi:PIN domain-containing protein [Candidatus Gottesmanbacteria bacterium]|nr:PIN domain-containing protein [Candidatus Gottesmanbacteria bacterium]
MEKVLIDTDVFIDFLRGYNRRIKDIFTQVEEKHIHGYISLITIIELYAGKDTKNVRKLRSLNQLLSFFEVVIPNMLMAKLAGKLKRDYALSLADSIIASTNILLGTRLLTFNVRHYRLVPDLMLFKLNNE